MICATLMSSTSPLHAGYDDSTCKTLPIDPSHRIRLSITLPTRMLSSEPSDINDVSFERNNRLSAKFIIDLTFSNLEQFLSFRDGLLR